LWWYSLLCQNYDVRTSNGLHNYERDILPMDLMIATEHVLITQDVVSYLLRYINELWR
jgi:hypothetical protein